MTTKRQGLGMGRRGSRTRRSGDLYGLLQCLAIRLEPVDARTAKKALSRTPHGPWPGQKTRRVGSRVILPVGCDNVAPGAGGRDGTESPAQSLGLAHALRRQ